MPSSPTAPPPRESRRHGGDRAGLYNTAGFNDDTRAVADVPSRHDVWRRVSCDWLAGLVVQGLLAEDEAVAMAHEYAYDPAKRAYRVADATGDQGKK
jgi:glucuronate isomerase